MSAINLALGRPAYSSTYMLPYTAQRAVDGNLTPMNRWVCRTLPGWMCVDLGAPYRIGSWTLRNMSVAGWISPDYNMMDFQLQGSNTINSQSDMSNNSLWTNLDGVTSNTASVVSRPVNPSVKYRYIRLYVTRGISCNQQLASVTELEIYKGPDSSRLTNLTLTGGSQSIALVPAFNMNTLIYTASVPYDISSAVVTPTPEDVGAVIKVNGTEIPSGQTSATVSLNVGANAIPVQVTAPDGSSQATYTVTVTREGSTYLQSITTSKGTITPDFVKTTLEYIIKSGSLAANTTITLTSEDPASTITLEVDSNTYTGTGTLSQIIVTQVAAKTAKVTVSRGLAGSTIYILTISK